MARNYISVIRRNWHLLPYDQLLALLAGMRQARLTRSRRMISCGTSWAAQPKCEPLKYADPMRRPRPLCHDSRPGAARVRGRNRQTGRPRFAFVQELSGPAGAAAPAAPEMQRGADEPIRFLYSYCAVYGDALTDERVDPYPDGLLERLRQVGVNGVWMHVVLRQLAPSKTFPEFGQGWEARLANLRKLVDRAGRHGIKIYLYMNEPRTMPESFFATRPEMRGIPGVGGATMCTSVPAVREWLTASLTHVFREVRGLGARVHHQRLGEPDQLLGAPPRRGVPALLQAGPADVIAEVNQAIAAGVRAGNPQARTIVWDWGWPNDWA